MPRVTPKPIERPGRLKLFLRRQRQHMRLVWLGVAGFAVVLGGLRVAQVFSHQNTITGAQERFGRLFDLPVRDILVTGRNNTPEPVLENALGVHKGDPILGFSAEAARARIESLSWVKHVAVERRLPGTIVVALTEKRPFAIWQYQQKFSLIDRDGQMVTDEDVSQFTQLPLVVGAGAPVHAAELIDALATYPDIRARVEASVRVGERRWNLQLKHHLVVMLPEGHEAAALARLAELQANQQMLDRPLAVIDLRLPDRLALRPRAGAPVAPMPAPAASPTSAPSVPVLPNTRRAT